MGDILLMKREKVSVQLKVNVITRKYKNYNYPVTSVNNLAPTTWKIKKNEESIQDFHQQIVDTRDTGQYMPDDRS